MSTFIDILQLYIIDLDAVSLFVDLLFLFFSDFDLCYLQCTLSIKINEHLYVTLKKNRKNSSFQFNYASPDLQIVTFA